MRNKDLTDSGEQRAIDVATEAIAAAADRMGRTPPVQRAAAESSGELPAHEFHCLTKGNASKLGSRLDDLEDEASAQRGERRYRTALVAVAALAVSALAFWNAFSSSRIRDSQAAENQAIIDSLRALTREMRAAGHSVNDPSPLLPPAERPGAGGLLVAPAFAAPAQQ